jgi:hypothetical protein
MKRSVFLTGLGFIIGPFVIWALLGLVIFILFYFVGGKGGIIAGTITATVGGALCLAFGILFILVGFVLLFVGALTSDGKRRRKRKKKKHGA